MPATTPTRRERLRSAIEDRTGLLSAVGRWTQVRLAGGPSWGQALGACLAALVALQFASGIGLTFFYSPSTTSAWGSIDYLERMTSFGAVIRGLHYHGTNAILILLVAHLLHVVLTAGYRRPREATWWAGLLTLFLVMAFAMTGALLPWDDQGYWASRVEIGIMGTAPFIGRWVQQLALGGNDLGNLTLTRYFTIHAIVLPAILAAVIAMHVTLVRRHGVSAPSWSTQQATKYWPGQTFRDATLVLLTLVVVLGLAIRLGAPLEAPADPTGRFPARPVWYFRALFELRRHFEGPIEPVATMLLPGLATAFLVALPFLDRAATLSGRAPYITAVVSGVVLAIVGTGVSFRRDAQDPNYREQRANSGTRAARARLAARSGIPPEGALFMLKNTPEVHGEQLFNERCLGCHAIGGQGTDKPNGPDLSGYGSRDWLASCIAHPEAPEYFGHTKVSAMDSYEKLGPERLQTLAAFLMELRKFPNVPPGQLPPTLKKGIEAFQTEGCDSCHSLTPGETNASTNQSGYGSEAWLTGLMQNPGAELYFGADNDMPSYRGKLNDKDFHDLVAYLAVLRDKPVFHGPPPRSATIPPTP